MKIKSYLKTNDDFIQYDFLNTPLNIKKSGYTRYGAAMYFYNKGLISEDALEIYRAVSYTHLTLPTKRIV